MKRRVAEYFETRTPNANMSMVVKTLVLLSVTFGSYGLILSNRFSPWQMLGLAAVMGVGVAGIGFGISHDALHGAYSSRPTINKLLGFSFELVGASSYMWKITHNVIHHTYPNIHGLDEDLEVSPLLRLSPQGTLRRFHRFQHLYAFAAYSLTTLSWVLVKDYRYFLRHDLGPFHGRRHPRSEVATLIAAKLLYYGYTIVVPLMILRIAWWQFLIGFLVMHLTAGLILGIVFQLAHVVEDTGHPSPPANGRLDHAWMVHQMETTSNFAMSNRLLSWYVGGLNYQVEHHLFPRVCSVHYPALSRIVRETAEEHGVTYHRHETLGAAIRSHYRTLKRLGNPPIERRTVVSRKVLVVLALATAVGAAAAGIGPAQASGKGKPANRAKVSMKTARATALAKVPGGTIQAAELEREHGKLIYSFDIGVPGKAGIEEVQVDAINGDVVSMTSESPKAERKEAQQEKQEGRKSGTGAKAKEKAKMKTKTSGH